MRTFRTLDAHVAGEGVRLLVEGGPSATGRTMQDKLAWARKHAERLRQRLMLEPRGHAGIHGAWLTEPVSPRAHAGILFMHAAGFPAFAGDSVMAAISLAIENKLLHIESSESDELLIDTPAGLVKMSSAVPVALTGLPSFVLAAGLPVQVGARAMRVDIAYGGEFYAIVDSESAGVTLDAAHASQLVRAGIEVRKAVSAAREVQGTIFTGPARGAADLRSATVLEGGILKRSPGVGSTCALMAVLDAMGLVVGGQRFTNEGVLGTTLEGWISSRQTPADDEPATVIPIVEGTPRLTGRHEFVVEEDDPLTPFAIST